MSNVLRPGELFGLRWNCFDPDRCPLEIKETTYKGKIRRLGKTKGSLTSVPIAKQLAEELVEWKGLCKDSSPKAFIFAGRTGRFLDSSHYRKTVVIPPRAQDSRDAKRLWVEAELLTGIVFGI
jgi:integrase